MLLSQTNPLGVEPRGGHLGIFWVGMCRPGLQIGTPFLKKFPLKLIPRSRNGPIFYTPWLGCNKESNGLLVNALNRIFKSNLSLNTFKWLLTKVELSCARNIIPRSRKRL